MNLKHGLPFAQCIVAHGFWHENKAPGIHGRQLGAVKYFSGTDPECSLKDGNVFVRRMLVNGDLGAIRTPNTKHERFSLGTGISGNVCVFTPHKAGLPLELACMR